MAVKHTLIAEYRSIHPSIEAIFPAFIFFVYRTKTDNGTATLWAVHFTTIELTEFVSVEKKKIEFNQD